VSGEAPDQVPVLDVSVFPTTGVPKICGLDVALGAASVRARLELGRSAAATTKSAATAMRRT
jgi:hypothetical protein